MKSQASVVMNRLSEMSEQAKNLMSKEHEFFIKKDDWRGLGYILNGQRVVSSMNEVREIIDIPDLITIVPDTKPWFLGLTNLRGEVVPVTDLQFFMGGSPAIINSQAKVLIVKNRGKHIGLLVPALLGIQSLSKTQLHKNLECRNQLDRFVYEIFKLDDEIWPVVSMAALLNDRHFLMRKNVN